MIEMEVCSPARTNNGSKQEEERGPNPGAGLELTTTLIQAGPPTAYFTTVPWNPFETTQSKIRKPYLLGSWGSPDISPAPTPATACSHPHAQHLRNGLQGHEPCHPIPLVGQTKILRDPFDSLKISLRIWLLHQQILSTLSSEYIPSPIPSHHISYATWSGWHHHLSPMFLCLLLSGPFASVVPFSLSTTQQPEWSFKTWVSLSLLCSKSHGLPILLIKALVLTMASKFNCFGFLPLSHADLICYASLSHCYLGYVSTGCNLMTSLKLKNWISSAPTSWHSWVYCVDIPSHVHKEVYSSQCFLFVGSLIIKD